QRGPVVEVVTDLYFNVIRLALFNTCIAKVEDRLTEDVLSGYCAGYCNGIFTRHAVVKIKRLRLAVIFQAVVGNVKTQISKFIAILLELHMSWMCVLEIISRKNLQEIVEIHMDRTLLGNGRFNDNHAAHGIAAVLSGERAVKNFHLRNFAGAHHSPARRAVPAGLQKIMQGHAISEYH